MLFDIGTVSIDMIEEGDRVCAHIAAGKTFEPESLALWGAICAKKGNILDIGAYTGLYAISAAKLGCKVIAFEPMPFNAARLRDNARRNRAKIDLREMVASDKTGTVTITYNPLVPFTSGASLIRKNGDKLSIGSMRLDDLGLDQLTGIKIDVERGEPLVLAGAQETIARCQPAILVEVLDEPRKALVKAALPGYRIAAKMDDRNWLMLPR